MSVLVCENISFEYEPGKKVLDNVTLKIRRGERVVIVGENGSGKTTLSLICAGAYRGYAGAVHIDGRYFPFDPHTGAEFRRRIGYVFQNPEDGFVATDVYREAAYAGENFSIPPDILRRRVEYYLKKFGLWEYAHSSPLELSGGMKARLAIVSALVTGAEFFILDEPESFLDWRGQQIFARTLDEIGAQAGILHITQSPEMAQKGDKIYNLLNCKIKAKSHKELLNEVPDIRLNLTKLNSSGPLKIELENVCFNYGARQVLTGIDLNVKSGEIVGVVGASGAGKSTLALMIAGFLEPHEGKVLVDGRAAILFQFPERQLFAETVKKDVMFGPKNLGLENPEKIAEEKLRLVDLDPKFWESSPFALSDGQQRRAGIAGVLATEPDIIIFDEPFASLDYKGIAHLFRIIADLSRRGATIILITHRTDLLIKLAPRTVALAGGKIAYDGPTEKLLSDTDLCEKVGIKPLNHRI